MSETSKPLDMLLGVSRDGRRTLGSQIEDQLRQAIRGGALRPAARLPSTRELARQLGVSRRVVVDAYAQLGAEGYLVVRQGSRPQVSGAAGAAESAEPTARQPVARARFDFRPNIPDLSTFPRPTWLRSIRQSLAQLPDAELDYGDPRGVERLRIALAGYLGRVRGVIADPGHIVVTSGYAQGRALACDALAATGAKRIAIEDPSHPEQRAVMVRAGLELVPIPVDEAGIRVEELAAAAADAVVLTPAHQFPSGAVLAADRRTALLEWLRDRDAIAIEDDYDAEYRYDRTAIGAVQGLDPSRVVYAGSASKTLAPALRLGWLVVPERLLEGVVHAKRLADLGTARIEQHALADFLERGELDRHLRRMRARYRKRRDALVTSLETNLPEAEVEGIAAGLHAAVRLAETDDEQAILAETRPRGIALTTMSDYRIRTAGPPTLVLGYAQSPEPTIRTGTIALAEAIRATRRRERGNRPAKA